MLDVRAVLPVDRGKGEIPIVILQYKNSFTAYPLEVDGVVSQGYDLEDALKKVKEALALHVAAFSKNVLPPMDERATRAFLANIKLDD